MVKRRSNPLHCFPAFPRFAINLGLYGAVVEHVVNGFIDPAGRLLGMKVYEPPRCFRKLAIPFRAITKFHSREEGRGEIM